MSQVKLKFFVMPNSETHAQPQKCDSYGCAGHGLYKAPKSRSHLRDYYWFCLTHIRDYNSRWDYFKDMERKEIEASVAFDDVWQRSTRPFAQTRFTSQAPQPLPVEVIEALKILDLHFPFSLGHLKTQYKQLVKENHPDLHGDDPLKCESLKKINLAYDVLQAYLLSETPS